MSFKNGAEYLKTYRKDRAKSLDNRTIMAWSTAYVDSMDALFEKFDTKAENAAWQAEYVKAKPDVVKLVGLRDSVLWPAGCRRDLAVQFRAAKRCRIPMDQDRFEQMRLSFANYKQLEFVQWVEANRKAGGSQA